jgi:hypothetical protein
MSQRRPITAALNFGPTRPEAWDSNQAMQHLLPRSAIGGKSAVTTNA